MTTPSPQAPSSSSNNNGYGRTRRNTSSSGSGSSQQQRTNDERNDINSDTSNDEFLTSPNVMRLMMMVGLQFPQQQQKQQLQQGLPVGLGQYHSRGATTSITTETDMTATAATRIPGGNNHDYDDHGGSSLWASLGLQPEPHDNIMQSLQELLAPIINNENEAMIRAGDGAAAAAAPDDDDDQDPYHYPEEMEEEEEEAMQEQEDRDPTTT